MAAVKKTRGRIWENTETCMLLQKWGDENIQIKLKSCTRKKPIWLEISAFLRAAGYEDRDEDACKTRIHTLISAYRAYKDECVKTGNATPKKKPAFFDEVEELLSEKPCTRPKIVINSAQIVVNSLEATKSEDECSDENKEPNIQQNNPPNIPSTISTTASCPASCSTSNEPKKHHVTETTSKNAKKRKISTTDAFSKIDKALEAFVSYQQAADRSFLEAEEAREKREEEREEKRRKEDQDFLLKLAQVLRPK